MGKPVSGSLGWANDLLVTFGYLRVAILMLVEVVFPPVPSELILPWFGFLAGQGRLSLGGVIVATTFGSVLGGLILYGAGFFLGERRLRELLGRYGRPLFLK